MDGRGWYRKSSQLAGAAALVLLVLSAACGKPAIVEKPPPTTVAVDIVATVAVNPDADGRPSPLAVRVYQLTNSTAFMKVGLDSLWYGEEASLGAELVSRDEFMLAPGAGAKGSMTLDPRTRYVGVAAAFRDFRNATWRKVEPVPGPPEGVPDLSLTVALDVASLNARIRPTADAGADK